MKTKESIEIPFGAFDSELNGWEYTIPEGMEAEIKDGKIIVRGKESEDERMRKFLAELVKAHTISPMRENALAWLEKQGEKNLANSAKTCKDEPKFKVGDWLVHRKLVGETFYITQINEPYYYLTNLGSFIKFGEEDNYRLWTIQDAKDGDVLANEEMIVIFKYFEEPSYRQHIVAYIGLDTSGNIQITDETWTLGIDKAKPATKEQRDLLFRKMKEAGYEWNAEKKELKKIEQNPAEWKPSEEQMASLRYAVNNMKSSACFHSPLVHLLQDLEKLTE